MVTTIASSSAVGKQKHNVIAAVSFKLVIVGSQAHTETGIMNIEPVLQTVLIIKGRQTQ